MSGRLMRRIITPRQTSTNANSVPMLVSSASTSMGNMPPAIAQTTPVMMVVM